MNLATHAVSRIIEAANALLDELDGRNEFRTPEHSEVEKRNALLALRLALRDWATVNKWIRA